MKIPLLDLNQQYQSIQAEIQEAIQKVLENTNFIMGDQVAQFEQAMAQYCGVKHAIGVASGTDALLIALKAIGIEPGDEVIVPTFTFFATAGAVSRLGGTPIFVDIDPVTYNLNPAEIRRVVTAKTKAIIPVHLYGQAAKMDSIMELAKEYNLQVIEDACQAIGASYQGTRIGLFGAATALSFFPSKNLGAYGDGGMILTNDDELATLMKHLRVHGSNPKYYHKYVGYNSRLDTLQAAVLQVKLKYLDQWNEGRQRVADLYNRLFQEWGLTEKVVIPTALEGAHHVFHQYVVRVKDRDELQKFLKTRGIATTVYYPLCLHLQECYRELGMQEGDLPVGEAASKEVLALPIYPELTSEEQDYIVRSIQAFYQNT